MHVLLGIGGSDDSIRALEAAVERAKTAGDDLTVAIVENDATDSTPEEIADRVEAALAEAGFDASVRHLEGDPGSRLVEVAEAEGFDQIVLGGGQTSPMGKIKIGSIAEFVLLNSHTSVKLIR
jgi:nucleotide-binding universal stress UspA family protein